VNNPNQLKEGDGGERGELKKILKKKLHFVSPPPYPSLHPPSMSNNKRPDQPDLGNVLTDPSIDLAVQTLSKKPKKDFADEVLLLVPQASGLAEQGQLKEAVDVLLALEKRARLGGDAASAGEAALAIV